mmetsp:Transcript_39523/g.91270  ORF Transcript_39523/g.91270 Transcript_39523/m.91270 type:complete len:298 (-) Transcript_39523:652-1545(-)
MFFHMRLQTPGGRSVSLGLPRLSQVFPSPIEISANVFQLLLCLIPLLPQFASEFEVLPVCLPCPCQLCCELHISTTTGMPVLRQFFQCLPKPTPMLSQCIQPGIQQGDCVCIDLLPVDLVHLLEFCGRPPLWRVKHVVPSPSSLGVHWYAKQCHKSYVNTKLILQADKQQRPLRCVVRPQPQGANWPIVWSRRLPSTQAAIHDLPIFVSQQLRFQHSRKCSTLSPFKTRCLKWHRWSSHLCSLKLQVKPLSIPRLTHMHVRHGPEEPEVSRSPVLRTMIFYVFVSSVVIFQRNGRLS